MLLRYNRQPFNRPFSLIGRLRISIETISRSVLTSISNRLATISGTVRNIESTTIARDIELDATNRNIELEVVEYE